MGLYRMRRWIVAAATILAATATLILPGAAHSPSDPSIVGNVGKLMAKSNLVFFGKVKAVKYRNAESATSGPIPYAFVTYTVKETIFGRAKSEITLRFPGGTDGRGGFMAIEGVPVFSPGDEDILFVADNGEKGCAIVECEFGRYRVHKGAVYEAHGSPVLSASSDRIETGGAGPDEVMTVTYPAPSFDDLLGNAGVADQIRKLGMTVEQARARYAAEAPKNIVIERRHGGAGAREAVKTGLPVALVLSALRTSARTRTAASAADIADADVTAQLPAMQVEAAAPPN